MQKKSQGLMASYFTYTESGGDCPHFQIPPTRCVHNLRRTYVGHTALQNLFSFVLPTEFALYQRPIHHGFPNHGFEKSIIDQLIPKTCQ